jgi:hypothetical protein
MQRPQKRKARNKDELMKALESVLYEMLILATALVLRDKRYCFQHYPGLQWGPPQIANDVIRLKARLLLDFFYPAKSGRDDILLDDFKIESPLDMLDGAAFSRLDDFRKKVNKWTIHLTWTRTSDVVYGKSDRQSMEQYALDLLRLGDTFIEECLSAGFELDGWAKSYYDNFKRLDAYLEETPRVEEGKGKRPASLICLESLS